MTTERIKLPYTLVKVSGPDAEKFLQGQLSCDVSQLAENGWSYGTANSAKGRMYWLFVIARIGDEYWLRVHDSIVEQGVNTLSKYMVFFKCTMTTLSDYAVYGLPNTSLEFDHSIHADEKGYVRGTDAETQRIELWSSQTLDAVQSETALAHWTNQECVAGLPELYDETIDTFILQHLNLQDLGAVSFKKGCYTGQEIIARMKFLGKVKKKMYRFSVTSDIDVSELNPGDHIIDSEGKKSGELVRYQSCNGQLTGLLVADISSVENNTPLFLQGDRQQSLSITHCPYQNS